MLNVLTSLIWRQIPSMGLRRTYDYKKNLIMFCSVMNLVYSMVYISALGQAPCLQSLHVNCFVFPCIMLNIILSFF